MKNLTPKNEQHISIKMSGLHVNIGVLFFESDYRVYVGDITVGGISLAGADSTVDIYDPADLTNPVGFITLGSLNQWFTSSQLVTSPAFVPGKTYTLKYADGGTEYTFDVTLSESLNINAYVDAANITTSDATVTIEQTSNTLYASNGINVTGQLSNITFTASDGNNISSVSGVFSPGLNAQSSIVLTGLSAGTTYSNITVSMQAETSSGDSVVLSAVVPVSSFTTSSPPPTITSPDATCDVTSTDTSLIFSFPSGSIGGDTSADYTVTVTEGGNQVGSGTGSGDGTTITISGLTPSTTYSYTLTVTNSEGSANGSGTFDTLAPPPPISPPTYDGTVVTATSNSITFTFPSSTSGNDPNAFYSVWLYDASLVLVNGSPATATGNGATITFTTDITPSTTYQYQYQVTNSYVDGNGNTGDSGGLPLTPITTGAAGGGGNNNGGGQTNMAELEYKYDGWSADVTQTNTITVLGEDSAALDVDETIVVHVPLSKLKECVVYESGWTVEGEAAGTQPLPKVAFRPSETYAAKTELDAMFAKLKAKMDDQALADRVWDDDASGSHDSFGRIMINSVSFGSGVSVFDSADLPKVAIRSIAEGDITVDELTTTVSAVQSDLQTSHKTYLEGLFEQLVAADRIKKTDATSSNDPLNWQATKKPSLEVGDSLSFKVTYNFSKRREYEVDGDETAGQTKKALTLTIGGSTFTIQPGADGAEESEVYTRTYGMKLVAVADV